MSDRMLAAIERIRDLAGTIAHEAEGIDDELQSGASRVLVDAALLLEQVAKDFK